MNLHFLKVSVVKEKLPTQRSAGMEKKILSKDQPRFKSCIVMGFIYLILPIT